MGLLRSSSSIIITQLKNAHAVPLASARQHPENQKENQAGHSPERTVEGRSYFSIRISVCDIRGLYVRKHDDELRNKKPAHAVPLASENGKNQ